METHQSQEKSTKLPAAAPRDPLQTARTSLRLTNLFLQLTAQQNVPRRSVPTGLLTQLTISETMRSSPGSFLPMAPSAPGCSSSLEVGYKPGHSWRTCVSCSFWWIRSRPAESMFVAADFILKCWNFCTKILLRSSQLDVILSHSVLRRRGEVPALLLCWFVPQNNCVITAFSVLLQNSNPL